MSAALEAVQVPSVNGTEAGSAVRVVFVVSRALESSCPQSLVHFFDRLLGFLNAGRWSRQFQCVPETQGHAEMKSTSNVCGVNPYVSFSVQTYTDTFQSSVSPPSPSPLRPAASVGLSHSLITVWTPAWATANVIMIEKKKRKKETAP